MSFKNELDIFYGLFKQHLNSTQKTTLRWVTCKEIRWEDGTMTASDEDGREYFRVMLGTGSLMVKPKIDTDCLIGIVHGHEEMTFLISASEVDLVVYNEGENGGLINVAKLNENLNSLKSFVESINSAIPNALTAVGAGAAANGPAGATSYNTAMAGKTIEIKAMEDTKITH